MLKKDLIAENEALKEKLDDAEYEIGSLQDAYCELERKLDERQNSLLNRDTFELILKEAKVNYQNANMTFDSKFSIHSENEFKEDVLRLIDTLLELLND